MLCVARSRTLLVPGFLLVVALALPRTQVAAQAAPASLPAQSQATPSAAPGQVSATTTTTVTTPAVPVPEVSAPAAASPPAPLAWDLLHRRYNSWTGPTGGLALVDASTGEPGAVRIQLGLDFFYGSDYLSDDDKIDTRSQTLSISVTALEMLELYASLGNRGATQSEPVERTLDTLGDFSIGAKVAGRLAPAVWLSGDLRAQLGGEVGGSSLAWDSTSVGLRAALSFNLQELEKPVPFIGRLNVGYLFDSSANLVSDEESRRYRDLDDAEPKDDETRHLVSRFERLAFGVNRLDRLGIGAGVEIPLQLAEGFFLHPMLEWQVGVPVNRQDYDCPFVPSDEDSGERGSENDSCFERAPRVVPMNLLFGVRVVPPLRGVSVLVGADIGLSGTDFFVRELTPNLPYRVLIGLSYDYDARPVPVRERVVVQTAPPVAAPVVAAAPTGRIQGQVSTSDGTAVAGAIVSFVGKPLTALYTGADGTFVTEPLPPGEVQITVSQPDHEPGNCAAVIPPAGGDVALRCTLVAKPKVGKLTGRITDTSGSPVAGARIALTAPNGTGTLVTTDSAGHYESVPMTPGTYAVRIEAGGYFSRQASATIEKNVSSNLSPALLRKPNTPSILLRADNSIEAPALSWAGDSTQLTSRAELAVAELAELLFARPDLRVRIQAYGSDLVALPRALAVKQKLVEAGVAENRIEALSGGPKTKVRILLVP